MSAFCFSPEIVDLHIFQLWLRGLTVSQATSVREDSDPMLRDILELDTADHFRFFEELQPSLEEPRYTLCLVDIAPSIRSALAEGFYSFDDIVIREFLGRKFTSRTRKDLDDISEVTGVPRRSCLRQFDNLKRIYDTGDEFNFQIQYPAQTRLADVLREEFFISKGLMSRYEAILFLMYHRFNLSTTGKRKLALGSLRDLEFCAVTLMNAWCVRAPFQPIIASSRNQSLEGFESPPPPHSASGLNASAVAISSNFSGGNIPPTPNAVGSGGGGTGASAGATTATSGDFSPFELDVALFSKFRDFKVRAIQYQGEIWTAMASGFRPPEPKFRAFFRALLQCATGKDLKDFFEDLIAGVVEPVLEMRTDVEKFSETLDKAVLQTFSYADVQIWNALMAGIRPCMFRLITAHPQRPGTVPETEPAHEGEESA